MKKIIISLLFILAACASKNTAKFKIEENSPKFSNAYSFIEKPEQVRSAARAVLEEANKESDPAASGAVREDDDSVQAGWIYSTSKDKYIVYDFNGAPKRRLLPVRRKISYNISPSLSGSQVTVKVEEEIQELDLKTGEPKGWKHVAPDQNIYDQYMKKIRVKIRSL